MFRSWLAILTVTIVLGSGPHASVAQVMDGKTLVKAELISSARAIAPGETFYIGLKLTMAPGWHTYWEYPGDAGIPTKIKWDLPAGFGAGPIEWPIPKAKLEPGDIEVYGYSGEVVLLIAIQPPADLTPGTEVTLRGVASWLVCEEICIPGSAQVEITLPVAATAIASDFAKTVADWQTRVPSAETPPFDFVWSESEGFLTAQIPASTEIQDVRFFPLPGNNQSVGHPIVTKSPDGAYSVKVKSGAPLRGVIAANVNGEDRSWLVVAQSGIAEMAETSSDASPGLIGTLPPLWQALLFGFLGGVILNLMPCVLPVISLKVFGFIRQAGDDPRRILLHGVAFSSGIFLWFLGLGAVIVALKASGTEVTWAFQFQNPMFILVIAAVVFVFALNLCGVFELTLPGKAVGTMSDLSGKEGFSGSFFQGVFATLLATPCTGPFLGTALGFAFSQPGGVVMAMFGSIALGMASPYLLLSARPGWMKFLPKPGAWMEKLKQFMAFPLFATLLWLLSILGGQKGIDGILWTAAFLLSLGLAVWIYGAFCGPLSSVRTRIIAVLCALGVAVGGGWVFIGSGFLTATASAQYATASKDGIQWQPFSQALVDDLLAEGKPVFIDFTADWCITCKFNERTAINTPAVRALIEELGVIPIKADWTNSNPEITAALKEFGRVGVPFYVIYPAGRANEPITLPEILTESIVIEALKKSR
ncbi:MAG: protein-disulfide reductase DsbD family protein [Chthoniobacterales bacterium]